MNLKNFNLAKEKNDFEDFLLKNRKDFIFEYIYMCAWSNQEKSPVQFIDGLKIFEKEEPGEFDYYKAIYYTSNGQNRKALLEQIII